MKAYSIIIICLTLGVFYGLAVKLEHQKKSQNCTNQIHLTSLAEKNAGSQNNLFNKCSNNIIKTTSDNIHSVYYDNNDDFSMQVTGKERIYLNIGISYIELNNTDINNNVETLKGSGS